MSKDMGYSARIQSSEEYLGAVRPANAVLIKLVELNVCPTVYRILPPIKPYLRNAGKTVSLCHGVFDLVHPGHIIHLEQAKASPLTIQPFPFFHRIVACASKLPIQHVHFFPVIPKRLYHYVRVSLANPLYFLYSFLQIIDF